MTNFIKNFWDTQAKTHGQSASASWGDQYAINLEVEAVSNHIKNGDSVLDVGCANGHATLRQCELNRDITIIGVDYSEPMIEEAKKNYESENDHVNTDTIPKMKASFQVADIKSLPFKDESFDVTYTTRVLINLPTWEEQIRGINECIRVTKKGGTIILSEGFYEPLQKLNAIRLLCNLEPLVEHDFNRYLKKSKLEDYLNTLQYYHDDGFTCDDFSSIYYLGSRFLREIVKAKGQKQVTSKTHPAYAENPINKEFFGLENNFSGEGFGIQQAYIIKKY